VHDAVYFETQGIPAVFVMTSEFTGAAQTQSDALGMPDVRRVVVPHPIQDRTDDEIHARAEAVVEELIEALTA
jgi:hypothetical protein